MTNTSENYKNLLSPYQLGPFKLKNRGAMASLTRMRADPKDGLPLLSHHKYFKERAEDAGFILTDCMAVEPRGESFPGNLNAYSEEHLKGLTELAKTVHSVGGVIFAQLYHCGRSTNKVILQGKSPVAPSRIKNNDRDFDEPEALTLEGIEEIQDHFSHSIKLIKEAGFDGVELHGANGYLIDQFFKTKSNQRTDKYGGSIENRSRFGLELLDRAINIFGNDRVGIKLSPVGRFNDMNDDNAKALMDYLLPEINKRKPLFVELMRGRVGDEMEKELKEYNGIKEILRDTTLIGNVDYTPKTADDILAKGSVDMISFGTLYISNPDLLLRAKNNWPYTKPDPNHFHGRVLNSEEKGFSDYEKYKA